MSSSRVRRCDPGSTAARSPRAWGEYARGSVRRPFRAGGRGGGRRVTVPSRQAAPHRRCIPPYPSDLLVAAGTNGPSAMAGWGTVARHEITTPALGAGAGGARADRMHVGRHAGRPHHGDQHHRHHDDERSHHLGRDAVHQPQRRAHHVREVLDRRRLQSRLPGHGGDRAGSASSGSAGQRLRPGRVGVPRLGDPHVPSAVRRRADGGRERDSVEVRGDAYLEVVVSTVGIPAAGSSRPADASAARSPAPSSRRRRRSTAASRATGSPSSACATASAPSALASLSSPTRTVVDVSAGEARARAPAHRGAMTGCGVRDPPHGGVQPVGACR